MTSADSHGRRLACAASGRTNDEVSWGKRRRRVQLQVPGESGPASEANFNAGKCLAEMNHRVAAPGNRVEVARNGTTNDKRGWLAGRLGRSHVIEQQ